MRDLSIIIPARNEMFLRHTIEDILANMKADTEVIAVCDGNWPDPPINDDPRVTLIYHSESIGQRAATNEAARLSRAKFIMKADAHCAFDEGYDVKLMENFEYDWTVVPRMFTLHAFDWHCKACGKRTYQGKHPLVCECGNKTDFERVLVWKPRKEKRSDYMWFDKDLRFSYFDKNFLKEYGDNTKALKKKYHHRYRDWAQGDITDQMVAIGACWMMHRERYWELGGVDEKHGSWGQMGVEIACKSWLSGGRQVVNKKTWFAHMARTQGGDFGFPYPLSSEETEKAREYSRKLWLGNTWLEAKHPLSWMIERFSPLPGWDIEKPSKALVYYTDNHAHDKILMPCQKQLLKCMEQWKHPVISVSQKPIDFGHNIVMDLKRSVLSMYKQILRGLQEAETDIIFMIEHDLLYHPSHFDFTPERKDTYYYDRNLWALDEDTGKAVYYLRDVPSMLCAYRDLLVEHYQRKVDYVSEHGFKGRFGFSPPKGLPKELRQGRRESYMAEFPSIDIRHSRSLTAKRMNKDQFRSKKSRREWKEAEEIPGWGRTKDRFTELLQKI